MSNPKNRARSAFPEMFPEPTAPDPGPLGAFLHKIGATPERVQGTLEGRIEPRVEWIETVKKLVDRHGRCIPAEGLKARVVDANRSFHVCQTEINHAEVISRLVRFLDTEPTIPVDELQERCQTIHERVEADDTLRNLNRGPFVDLWVPVLPTDDPGQLLDERLLPAVGRVYREQFPERKFYNHREGTLQGQVSYAPGVEAERKLLQQGGVARLYLTPLQGFSVLAQREQVESLPDWIGLAGMLMPLAMIAHCEKMARDYHTPGYDLAALNWQSAEVSLYLGALDVKLDAGGWGDLRRPDSNYSGGLFVAG